MQPHWIVESLDVVVRRAGRLFMWFVFIVLDFFNDQLLFLLGFWCLATKPFVKSRTRHLNRATKNFNQKAFSMPVGQLKPSPFSLAKKAVAFFKMSRSIFCWRFSKRSRLSSATTEGRLVDLCLKHCIGLEGLPPVVDPRVSNANVTRDIGVGPDLFNDFL